MHAYPEDLVGRVDEVDASEWKSLGLFLPISLWTSVLGRWSKRLSSMCIDWVECRILLTIRLNRRCRGELLVKSLPIIDSAPRARFKVLCTRGRIRLPIRRNAPCTLIKPVPRPLVTCLIGTPSNPLITCRIRLRNPLKSLGTAGTLTGSVVRPKGIGRVRGMKLKEIQSRFASKPVAPIRVCSFLPIKTDTSRVDPPLLLLRLVLQVASTRLQVRFKCRGQTIVLIMIVKPPAEWPKLKLADIIPLTPIFRNLIGVPTVKLCTDRLKRTWTKNGLLLGGVKVAVRLPKSGNVLCLLVVPVLPLQGGLTNVTLFDMTEVIDRAPIPSLLVLKSMLILSVP